MEEQSFGHWLRLRRKALDLTQDALADRVGCSVGMVRKIESEERRPSAQIIERLADIFNIPAQERTAFLRFARGDWRSVPAEIIEDAPWHVSTKSPRSNLPASISSLVGREQAIADIRNYLSREDIRLVTLIGPPGIGKTRLSIETARTELSTFPDGVFFVALAPLDDPSLIALTIVQALGYVETKHVPTRQQLMDGIGGKQMLILLDNCEHLIENVAPLTSDLLSACSQLKILATSREALRVPGEWLYPVPVLAVPKESSSINIETASKFPGLALFAERARAVRPDFALNAENIQAVSSICAQLDGLPLAIELIAARIRLMSPESLLARLDDQFTLFADGMRALPPRQKTLNNAIAWSYNLLSDEEKKLFAYLSIFSGGFTLEAAETIFSRTVSEKSVTDLIASLLDKSLLQRTLDEDGEPRFNMLVTIHQFALDHLRNMGEEKEIRNWHVAYFLDFAENANKEIHGPDQVIWLDRLEAEHDNFRAVLDWCITNQSTEAALRLSAALGWTWLVRGYYSEVLSWFDKLCALPNIKVYPLTYAKLLHYIGYIYSEVLSDFSKAHSILEESRAIWLTLETNGEQGLAEVLNYLGMVIYWSDTNSDHAQSLFEQSFRLYQNHANQQGIAESMFLLGIIAGDQNNHALALSLFEQSLDRYRHLGDLWGIGRLSELLGREFFQLGNYEKARQFFEEHLSIDEKLKARQGIVIALRNLGTLYRYQGDYDRADQYYGRSLLIGHEYGMKSEMAYSLFLRGLLALHRNDYLLARQQFITSLDLSKMTYNEIVSAAKLLNGLAAVKAGTNQPQRAAKLYGAAQGAIEMTEFRIPAFDQTEFDRHIQIAREQLSETLFETLAAEGRAMTMEQAIDYALERSIYS